MRANPSMKGRAPWPPRRSRAEERRLQCALMYNFEVEVPTRTDVCGGGRDLNATGCAGSGDPRCENSGFWKSGRPLSRFVHHY
jgi:hypothetical protein